MPSANGPRRRTIAAVALGIVLSATALWALAQLVEFGRAAELLSRAHVGLIALALGSLAGSMILRTVRWRIIMPQAGKGRLSTARLVPYVLIGYAGNAVAPLRAGDAGRGVLSARRFGLGIPETVGSVALERVIDGLALAVLLLTVSIGTVVPVWFTQASAILALGGVAMVTVVMAFGNGVRSQTHAGSSIVRRFWRGTQAGNGKIAGSFAWSVAAWCLDGLTFWLCAVALGLQVSPLAALLIAGGAALGSVAPSAPAAIGTFELAGTAVAIALGVGAPEALAFVVLGHAVTVVPIIAAAAIVTTIFGLRWTDVLRLGSVGQDVGGRAVSEGSAP